jgi:TfoX/Sxy family transcriptional regulator of competence genes
MVYDEVLADRIRTALSGQDAVAEKRMFGGLAFLIGGHMAVAASRAGGLMLRVDPERTEELLGEPHTEPFEMRGRPVDGWLRVRADGLDSDDELQRWVDHGVGYARSLPPK